MKVTESIWFHYIDPAIDAEELAGFVVQFFQIFSVPVEIGSEKQVRPQVYAVPVRRVGHRNSVLYLSHITTKNMSICSIRVTEQKDCSFPVIKKNLIYLKVKSSPIFCITSAEDSLILLPDLSVCGKKEY